MQHYYDVYVIIILCRFNCVTGESSARSTVDVSIQINRTGLLQPAVITGGFRYAVSLYFAWVGKCIYIRLSVGKYVSTYLAMH